jgi:plasmid stability protein
MKNQPINQPKKKYDFVNIPLEEEEKLAIRMKAASKNKSMAEYIRDLVRADMAQQMQQAGAGQ